MTIAFPSILPDNASSSAYMALLGILPLEAVVHKTLLNIFVNIIKNPKSVEFEIAKRQLVMRESPPKEYVRPYSKYS